MNPTHDPRVSLRLLPEWAPQAATLLCWPHQDSDWAPRLDAIQTEYLQLIRTIRRHQPVVVLVNDPLSRQALFQGLQPYRDESAWPVCCLDIPFTDTWVRDFGPLTRGNGQLTELVHLRFDGWGGQYESHENQQLCNRLAESGLFGQTPMIHSELVGEGGNLETDGHCLLSSRTSFQQRHNPEHILEQVLQQLLGLSSIHWLDCPPLPGDDTHGHVDTLARFGEDGSILWQPPPDPAACRKLEHQLAVLGRPMRRLPDMPEIIDQGQLLPASYANFLVVNGAVLVPAYGSDIDVRAAHVIARAFPARKIEPVQARQLIWQYGSLHCASMQIPARVDLNLAVTTPC